MQHDAVKKTEVWIAAIIRLHYDKPLDVGSYREMLPNGWLIFSQQAYQFLKDHPESCERIAKETGLEDPAAYFRLLKDKTENFKNDEKMRREDAEPELPLDKYFK